MPPVSADPVAAEAISAEPGFAAPVCADAVFAAPGLAESIPAALKPRPWYLYVLECRDGSLYTGIAVDVQQRYALHCSGKGARYTRAHPPKCVLAICAYADQSAATKAEIAFKKLKLTQKRAQLAQWLNA